MNTAWRSLLFTILAIPVFWAVGRIPNPFLTAEAMGFLYGPTVPPGFSRASFGPFVLGIGPALTGFFLVEIFSFFLPPLSRWRKQEFAGRARLNRASIALSFLIAAATAYFMVRQLIIMGEGMTSFVDGSLSSSMGVGAFFVGGFTLLYLGANLLTAYGLGNGFALFLLCGSLFRLADSFVHQYLPLQGPKPSFWPLALTLLILIPFYYFLSRRRTVSVVGPEGKSLELEVPPVLQGLIAWSLAWQLAALLRSIGMMRGWSLDLGNEATRYYTFLGLFLLSSVFLYWAAFGPRRILGGISGRLHFLPGAERKILEIAFLSFAVFAAIELLAFVPHPMGQRQTIFSKVFDLGSLVLLYVLGKDIIDNFRFLKKVPSPVLMGELDNIHLASFARALAVADGQPVYLKGFEYRRLMGFFQPLVKIRIYVSPDYAATFREKLGLENSSFV